MIVRKEILQAETKLMQIIDALNLLRFSFGLRNRRQQKRRQNSDDGDDDQQFNQRERGILILAAAGHAPAIPHFAFSFKAFKS